MRVARLVPLFATIVFAAGCAKTQDSPGPGDTAVPYGGAGANGSVGSTPGYLNAAGADKAPTAAPAAAPAPATPAATDTVTKAPAAH